MQVIWLHDIYLQFTRKLVLIEALRSQATKILKGQYKVAHIKHYHHQWHLALYSLMKANKYFKITWPRQEMCQWRRSIARSEITHLPFTAFSWLCFTLWRATSTSSHIQLKITWRINSTAGCADTAACSTMLLSAPDQDHDQFASFYSFLYHWQYKKSINY